MSKRTNPRNRPATQADVERAKRIALDEATNSSMAIFFTVLLDKYGWDVEQMRDMWNHVNDLSDSIVKGYVKIADLIRVLRDEYGIELK